MSDLNAFARGLLDFADQSIEQGQARNALRVAKTLFP